ncbi:MAG: DMT family transporter [Pseudomonadota bacterium]
MNQIRRTNSVGKGDYSFGVGLLVLSAFAFSSAGVFTKGVEAGALAVVFWRGVFAILATGAWAALRGRLAQEFVGMGYAGVTVGVVGAMGQVAFISAFKLTSIANVALIYAATPIVAALLAWLTLGERVGRATLVCAGITVFGVGVLVQGSAARSDIRGDVLAGAITLVMAAIMVIYRAWPKTPSGGPSMLQSLLVLPFAFAFGAPLETPLGEIAILAVFGTLFALSAVTLAEGAKRVPPGQTALIGTIETPLAIVLGVVVLAEAPNAATLAGGSIVLGAVLFSIWWTQRGEGGRQTP